MPCFQAHQPAPPSFSPPDGESPFCNVPHFRAHQPIPPSSSPPQSESSFPACHVSDLPNFLLLFLHPPPLSSLSLPSSNLSLLLQHASFPTSPPPSSPPLPQEGPFFATCHISELTNLLLPLPPLQQVSSCLPCAAFPSSQMRSS